MSNYQTPPGQPPQGGQPGPYPPQGVPGQGLQKDGRPGQPGPYPGGAPGPYPGGQPGPYPPQGAPQPGAYPGPGQGAPQPGAYPVTPGPVPPGMPVSPAGFGLAMKTRNPLGVWGLTLITLGIYGLVWWFKIQKELGLFDRRIVVNPGVSVLAFLPGAYIVVPPFVSVYNTATRIQAAQRAAGLPQSCSGGLGILLYILLGTHTIYYQSELNKINTHYRNPPEGTQLPLVA
ncbi:DUF4234 domain-containing protein [Streptomyces sp. NBC_01803]|uniref:DUF4234 domain-containing protein n=1 Tax=Streptomyces sp. NBC_01803 TaxID=2975946 RepID=UPI002DD83455|nr:DUF4234 domain-containing protein [Streptomyces sp. NBC_01803]WSA45865.1 DUF4234 domain-containing protein [Streptomyces sp. NBC_01803]